MFYLTFQLQEIDAGPEFAVMETALVCDVACFVYDITDPQSFAHCVHVFKVCACFHNLA